MEAMSPEKPEADRASRTPTVTTRPPAPRAPEPAAEAKREEMDFSKEFEILGKIDDDWRDYMATAGGAQTYTSEDAERRQHSSTRSPRRPRSRST